MSLLAMPLLVINMGCEMVYILEQRLHAQSVPADKSKRVLQDVIRTMYNPKFITELFKPQDIYSVHSTRQIFDRLAHSSIMRLNESSMDKLFDLMTMGFKFQLLSCTHPGQLLQVTLNHLHSLHSKVDSNSKVAELVEAAIQNTHKQYGSMQAWQFGLLRRSLCRFFQDKRVKVSLFLQDGIQNQDGTISIKCQGLLPPGVRVPGTIRYFSESGGETGADHYNHPLAAQMTPWTPDTDPAAACSLGTNLYKKEKEKGGSGKSGKPETKEKEEAPAPEPETTKFTDPIIAPSEKAEVAAQELNFLASIVGATSTTESFKINLFPDTDINPSQGQGTEKVKGSEMIVIDNNTKSLKESNQGLLQAMEEMDLKTGGGLMDGHADDEDDLLSLMDSTH